MKVRASVKKISPDDKIKSVVKDVYMLLTAQTTS